MHLNPKKQCRIRVNMLAALDSSYQLVTKLLSIALSPKYVTYFVCRVYAPCLVIHENVPEGMVRTLAEHMQLRPRLVTIWKCLRGYWG
jgi:hypothetical protein